MNSGKKKRGSSKKEEHAAIKIEDHKEDKGSGEHTPEKTHKKTHSLITKYTFHGYQKNIEKGGLKDTRKIAKVNSLKHLLSLDNK